MLNQIAYSQFFLDRFVRQFYPALMTLLILTGALGGCLSDSTEDSPITLVVEYEHSNGTVVQSFVDGELVSTSNVVLDFDFSKTVSEYELITFGIDRMDGSGPTIVESDSESNVSVEFETHGIYSLSAFVVDVRDQIENISIIVRIEMRIEWVESSTFEPKPMTINPVPTNGGVSPSSIFIDSTVENPELIEDVSSGREVEFTWSLVDGTEDACQARSGLVHEGEFVNWKTIHFNTFLEHEWRISYDSGQDYINVIQSVSIEYDEIE